MNIQGYQKLTLLDYPGRVACTLFLGGCNLRCPFCHNADLVRTPTAQASAYEDVMDYLRKRAGILQGVCVTGGEPLLHPDLPLLLREIKELGYAIKLDTNGSLPARLSGILSTGLVDYVAMDIKHTPHAYPKAVGCDLDFAPFEESIRILRESGIPYEFRTTAVKGIHEIEDFAAIAAYLGDEAYFIQKFVDSGNLLGDGCYAFSYEEMQTILSVVRNHTPRASLRG
ncbi:MAG: anaerobic ribonucleoside-triphosphate reductase activating protein [Ruminococcaceae bacterium]|nr:anaerobic ribonucleoside-triphosphate reductase activating protein [Oscillospiraceae bacterium]